MAAIPAGANHSVLFVCLGNICRSPIAEAVFKNLVKKKNCEKDWHVDSAATSRYEIGSPPDRRGLKVMKRHGLASNHRARQITHGDYHDFEYILCMDESNLADLKHMAPQGQFKAVINMLGTFDSEGPDIIQDPYYGDDRDFQQTYEQCLRACEGFLSHVNNQN